MVDLLPILLTATRTIQQRMEEWFSDYPVGMPWTIVSDYSIGDEGKVNDVFSFVVIANHTTADDIGDYISKVAPKDIKNVRQVPQGLMDYLSCTYPVTFSVSFVIEQKSALLRRYLSVEGMAGFIPDACSLLNSLRDHSPQSASLDLAYFEDVLRRFRLFEKDLERKKLNERLARQVHLASGFAAVMFHLVSQATSAGYLRWVSDRDKLVDHYDTIVYDLAFIYFTLLTSDSPNGIREVEGKRVLNLPSTLFELPEKTGPHRFDALIRLADYLAGSLADIRPDMTYSKEKFGQMLHGVFVNSPNNHIVQMLSEGDRITARRAHYSSS